MVNTFAHLRAANFIKDFPQKPDEEYGITTGTKVIATLKDASSTPTLYIGYESKDMPNQWFVRAEGQEPVYLIHKYMRDSLSKTLSELEATPTPTPKPRPVTDQEQLKKEAEKTAARLKNMTEEERQAETQKRINEILKNAATPAKPLPPRDTITTPTKEKPKK